MAFNISTFKQQMTGDGARPNLFRVTLGGASGYLDVDSDDHFFIRASSIPGGTIGQVVVPYFGREVKFAGNRTFAEWTVTVINDENFKTRGRLERWMERINNHQANLRSGNTPGGYFGTGTVTQLGKNTSTQTLRTYSFVNIFPTDLSEITLDWGDNDSIEEFTCTFAYDYWTATSSGSPATGATQAIIA